MKADKGDIEDLPEESNILGKKRPRAGAKKIEYEYEFEKDEEKKEEKIAKKEKRSKGGNKSSIDF
jgi:hypothetical protein